MKACKLIICPECNGEGMKWYISVPEYERDWMKCDVCNGHRVVYELHEITYKPIENGK